MLPGITIGRCFINRETRQAFHLMWRGVFDVIKAITGRDLSFKILTPSSANATCYGFAVDGDVAQALGIASAVMERPRGADSILPQNLTDAHDAIPYLIRTCTVHFRRCVSLASLVSKCGYTCDSQCIQEPTKAQDSRLRWGTGQDRRNQGCQHMGGIWEDYRHVQNPLVGRRSKYVSSSTPRHCLVLIYLRLYLAQGKPPLACTHPQQKSYKNAARPF